MRNLMTKSAVAFASMALTTGIVAFADPANATTGFDNAPQVVVQVSDLNLQSDAGRSTAKHRIERAVNEVCGEADIHNFNNAQCRSTAALTANHELDAHIANLG